MNDMECPYCGHEFDICTDDSFGCEPSVTYEQECPSCGKYFVFTMDWSPTYYPEKADCLNGEDHTWEASHTYPVDCVRMVCSQCDDDRDPTEDEWIQIEEDRGEKRGDWLRRRSEVRND